MGDFYEEYADWLEGPIGFQAVDLFRSHGLDLRLLDSVAQIWWLRGATNELKESQNGEDAFRDFATEWWKS